MNMGFSDAQSALGFVTPQFYNIETTIYQIKYPSFDFSALIPVVTEGNEWGRGTLFRSSDAAGKAEFISGKGFDMPYADVTMAQYLKGFEMAGIGYEWSMEEVNVAAIEGRNLGNEKAVAARGIAQQLLWNIAMSGSTEKNWTGLINDANVPAATVPATGSGSSTTWASKTPAQILTDINTALSGIYTTTQETEVADTILLPYTQWLYLSNTQLGTYNDTTVLEFIKTKNSYSAVTGQPLTIKGLRVLNTAGSGSTARMVAYRNAPDVLRFHLPMPHKFLPPFQKSSMTFEVAGIMRTGGTEVRLPKAMSYSDGI